MHVNHDVVRVFIWLPSGIGGALVGSAQAAWGADTGHVSLQVGEQYISFWHANPEALGKFEGLFKRVRSAIHSYEDDVREERRRHDRMIEFNSLDPDSILMAFRNYQAGAPAFYATLASSIFSQEGSFNCISFASHLLSQGGLLRLLEMHDNLERERMVAERKASRAAERKAKRESERRKLLEDEPFLVGVFASILHAVIDGVSDAFTDAITDDVIDPIIDDAIDAIAKIYIIKTPYDFLNMIEKAKMMDLPLPLRPQIQIRPVAPAPVPRLQIQPDPPPPLPQVQAKTAPSPVLPFSGGIRRPPADQDVDEEAEARGRKK